MSSITFEDNEIKYTNIQKPSITTGLVISKDKYTIENGELKNKTNPIINAIDINWGGALINDSTINTTSDLLKLIKEGVPTEPQITPIAGQGTYEDILNKMFGALCALNNEIIRLKNSFYYGINSRTGDDFLMNHVVGDIDVQEEEPLWAIDENELNFIDGADLSSNEFASFSPIDNFSVTPNEKISFTGELTWTADDSIYSEITDSKIYIYITSSTKNINVHLENKNQDVLDFNIKDIIPLNYTTTKYNILLIVSRKIKIDGTNYGSHDFVWLSVAEWGTGSELFNGYINNDGTVNTTAPETPVFLSDTFNIKTITFNTTSEDYLYKFDVYSRFQDFSSKPIEAAIPTNVEEFKYKAASITIRSINTSEKLLANVKKYQNNELIYCEENQGLFIYTNGNLINIGKGGNIDPNKPNQDIMETYQIIKALEEQGLITINFIDSTIENQDSLKYSEENIESYVLNSTLAINDIENIKFINDDTNKAFNVKMSPYGTFDIKELNKDSLAEQLKDGEGSLLTKLPGDFKSDRSFVSLFKAAKKNISSITGDLRLNADRIQIAAVYAPLKTDKVFGCSHAYIELSNTSDEKFYLDGCYLHYSATDNAATQNKADVKYYRLALDGYIPAGGTYLIRCKKYVNNDSDPNCFIHVDTYDKEWYVDGELIDLSCVAKGSYGFALTYGHTIENPNNADQQVEIDQASVFAKPINANEPNAKYSGKGSYALVKGFIDSFYLGADWGNTSHWVGAGSQGTFNALKSNSIYKITFELDPAKQAFNSMTTSDSSRARWQNRKNDYQTLELNDEYISFPKTEIKKAVSDYTPKASFEGKNVISDKTKLDKTKPNAVVCSFGINPYTTRCFNWVSAGSFNEAVVLINPNNNKEYIFESYKNKDITDYSKYGTATAETDPSSTDNLIIKTYTFDNSSLNPNTAETKFPRKHEFDPYINNSVYGSGYVINNLNKEDESFEYGFESANVGKRLYNTFPGNDEAFTSHKCIIDVVSTSVDTPETWQYYICRLDKYNKLDKSYKSEVRSFTLYPESYKPRVYQITDQQGFHWIEYQVWAAAAKKINEKIALDVAEENIMPIILNTGDATQSGARLNEWIDYYNAGDYLFNHLEQMNVVGNNDLCDTNVNALGTGDDTGKSNGFFFHIFNCYEIPAEQAVKIIETTTITTASDGTTTSTITKDVQYNIHNYMPITNKVYVPSLYYMDVLNNNKKIRLLFINSEITTINCRDWFRLRKNGDKESPVNIYTGFTIKLTQADQSYEANNLAFTPIYDILYNWTSNSNITYLPICHEMPFTVVTNACLSWTNSRAQYSRFRSLSDAATGALIGSHCNQIDKSDNGKGMHWMSRLFEYRGITLCLGGHKHTYACTYPVRENYVYTENGTTKYSIVNGPMTMEPTLENDSAVWTVEQAVGDKTLNLSKFPIVIRPDEHKTLDGTVITVDIQPTNNDGIPIQNTYVLKIKTENNQQIGTLALDGSITFGENETIDNYSDFDLINENNKYYPQIDIKIIPATETTAEKKEYRFKVKDGVNYTDVGGDAPYQKQQISTGRIETLNYHDSQNTTSIIHTTSQDTLLSPMRFFPCVDALSNDNNNFVVYLMCQATGYKLTSNKELPSEFQKFSMVIPKSYIDSTGADKPSSDQQMPMFAMIDLVGNNKYAVEFCRVNNISSVNTAMTFTQQAYGKSESEIENLVMSTKSINGLWCKFKENDGTDDIYTQTDTYKGSKVNLEDYISGTNNFKLISNVRNKLLYPDLLKGNHIYLFVIDNKGKMISTY